MEKEIIKSFNLPGYVKGKTFADASKAIEKKFEGRNDKASLDTKQEFLERLASAQENVRGPQPDTNQHVLGAVLTAANAGAAAGALPVAGAALGPIGLGATLAPMIINQLGKRSKQEKQELAMNQIQSQSAGLRSDFAMGGTTNQYLPGGFLSMLPSLLSITQNISPANIISSGNGMGSQVSNPVTSNAPATTGVNFIDKLRSFLQDPKTKNAIAGATRFAPVISNFLQNKNLERTITPQSARVTSSYTQRPVDVNSLINRVNQVDLQGAMSEASGGDLGAYRSGLTGALTGQQRAISDAVLQGEQINRGEGQFAFQNNLRRDMMNAQMYENYLQRSAQDLGAYNTAKSQFQSAMATDIGNIGKEAQQKELMKKMFGYDWMGNYLKTNATAKGGVVRSKRK